MDPQRRQEPQRWSERQGSRLCEGPRDEPKTAATRGRVKARLLLCKDEWYEEEAHLGQDRERPKLPD